MRSCQRFVAHLSAALTSDTPVSAGRSMDALGTSQKIFGLSLDLTESWNDIYTQQKRVDSGVRKRLQPLNFRRHRRFDSVLFCKQLQGKRRAL